MPCKTDTFSYGFDLFILCDKNPILKFYLWVLLHQVMLPDNIKIYGTLGIYLKSYKVLNENNEKPQTSSKAAHPCKHSSKDRNVFMCVDILYWL